MSRFVLAAALLAAACTEADTPKPAPAPVAPAKPAVAPKQTDVTAQDYAMPALPHARVTLQDAFGGRHVVDAEVAAFRDARTRGLMWRTQLPEGTGMLFIFPEAQPLNFWMKNTLIPLDIIFISKDRKIVNIQARAVPRTTDPRPADGDSQFVLEVPGGWSEKLGLKPGLPVVLDGLAGVQVSE
jgi:hypothetical protein